MSAPRSAISPTGAASANPTAGAPARIAGLDGLRALAVTAVVVYHAFPHALRGGFVGVDVFFVISGFLITSLLIAERSRAGRIDLKGFWRRRVRRIVPALALVVLAVCTAAFLVGGDVLTGLGWQVAGAATFSYNWLSITADASYFSATAPELLRNLWSLAVEEQFYVVWPLVLLAVLLIPRRGLRMALIGALAAASAVEMAVLYVPGTDPTRVYFGSDTHCFGLAIGALLALLAGVSRDSAFSAAMSRRLIGVLRPIAGIVAMTGLVAAAVILPESGPETYRGGLAAVAILTAALIWSASGSWVGRALDVAPLRAIGERSYGIYLWHWPVLVLVAAVLPTADATARGLVAVAIAVAAAAVSYRWLEQPIRRHGLRGLARGGIRRARTSRTGRVVAGAAAAGAVLLLAGTTAAIASEPHQTTAQAEIERGRAAMKAAAARAAAKASASPAPAPSATAAPPSGSDISAIGDSVMLAAAPELQARYPGMAIDAVVSRQMRTAPDLVRAQRAAGTLRHCVLIGLGTNGSIGTDTLEEIRRLAGPHRTIVFVNAFAPRDWVDSVNADLGEFAAGKRGVVVANWHDAIAPHVDVLADDGIHPGPTGGQIYTDAVTQALAALEAPAEQPLASLDRTLP